MDRGNRPDRIGGGWNGGNRPDDGGNANGRRNYYQPRPQPPVPQAQAQVDVDRGAGNRPDGRGNAARQWRGDRGGNGQPVALDRGNDRRDDARGYDRRDGNWRGDGGNRGTDWRANGNRNTDWRGNQGRNGNRFADRGGNDRGAWNRDWRRDGRYDWNARRQFNRSAFHLPRYYAPSGWNYGYRRLNIGFTLTSGLFGNNYWIEDPYYYGLPEAYGPYRWVRYYNDALLVDVYSGQVVDTVYDIFW